LAERLILLYPISLESRKVLKRISSLTFIAMLLVVLAGCGGGGSSSDNGTGTTNGSGSNVSGALVWDAPVSNTDGSPATDVAGYKIYYGTVSGTYTGSIDAGNTTSIPLATLAASVPVPGLYYIAVTAYDTAGNESVYSNEINQNL
jgi:hypothetical protein